MKLILFVLFVTLPAFARTSATGWCSKGGQVVMTRNAMSSTLVMRSYPSCTVTVLNSMGGMATLFSDNAGTGLANPFTANAIGQWTFFADPDEYSITLSGSLINAPFTIQMYVPSGNGTSGVGITSLNSLTAAAQTFATGTVGTDFGIVSATSTHTFNLPSSSASNRGLLTSADWTTFNAKQGALIFTAPLVNAAGTVALTLPITIGQGGTGQTTQLLGFNALSPLTTAGDLLVHNGTNNIRLPIGTDTFCLTADSAQAAKMRWAACSASGGSVSSVGLSFTGGLLSVAGSPVISSGVLAITLAGTSGGVPYFSSNTGWASSAALTAGLPIVGGGAGFPPISATRSGNTTQFVTTTGTQTSGNCVSIDANGNHIATGAGCAAVTLTTVTFSATPTFTRTSSIQEWATTLTGNVTSSTVSGAAAGDIFIFNICQDGTGARTFAWPTGFAQAATISATASACTKQTFYWSGGAAIALTPGVSTDTLSIIPPLAFASLPTCAAGLEGALQPVNDSTTATWGATITGGSTNHVMAYCDGTNWTVMGK